MNAIGTKEKHGRAFWFLNQRKEPFEWTDEVPEDDPEFQGLLEEEVALYPDVLTELPGVALKDDMDDNQVVTDEPKPNFTEQAAAALENVGIDPHNRLHALQGRNVIDQAPMCPAPVDYNSDKIVYKINLTYPTPGLLATM